MKQKNYTKAFSFALAVLLLGLLITQCLPFWNCSNCKTHEEDKMISIAEYILFPLDHKSVTNDMMDVYEALYGDDLRDADGKKWKFAVDDVLSCPLLVLVGCVLGIVLCLIMPNKVYGLLVGAVAGISGIMGYLLYLPLQIGPNWVLHLVVACIVAIAAVLALLYAFAMFVRVKMRKNNDPLLKV